MDEHQRYELCGEVTRNATYASVRGRNVLHHVQPVRVPVSNFLYSLMWEMGDVLVNLLARTSYKCALRLLACSAVPPKFWMRCAAT